uniref:Uncharacterized protein n=1 Tax=Anopheles merus TaxID=30066 RepID=A0A1I8JVC9_ANOME
MREKCRLCLKKIGARKGASITDDEFGAMLSRVFTFPVAVTESVLLVNVCAKCALTVRNFNAFSEEVEANQNVLLSELMVEQKGRELDDEKVEHTQVISSREPTVEPKGREVEDVEHGHSLTKPVLDQESETNEKKPVEKLADDDGGTTSMLPIEDMEVLLKEQLDDDFSPDDNNSTTHTDDKPPNSRSKKPDLHENDRIIMEFFEMRCELCPKQAEQSFDRFYTLQRHYRVAHQCRGFLRCCGRKLYRRFRVMEHIQSHRGTIRCGICDKPFKSKSYLMRHNAEQHVADGPSFACQHCERTFHTQRQLNQHLPAHETTVCKICGKTVNVRYLKQHTALIHGTVRQGYMCDLCGKNFSSSLALDRHIKQHQGIETIEKLDCPHCGKRLNGKYNLQKHVRCMHVEAGKSYRCEVCGHFSPNSVALENHKKRVHTGEHFECGECGKRFKQKIYLTEHMAALHTRKPLYACEFCEATFKSRANYYTHRKTRHRAEWEALREERKLGESKRLFVAADVITGVV